ncbi:MAG: ATP-dependent helicase [Candidatus Omnitrophota bacterium]|jgi:DNA helicase-2/ATP-dependent DNA helicase PcrA|nr:MAG: ATP-dependent helicase [Candidatus Omnitrophota bacterium]
MAKVIDYSSELNKAQLQAVESTRGPYLVIAGAGSGKTRVLVYRVAYLVENGVSPEEILLLTFTRKAAEEMLRRASLLLDNRCQRVSGGTFHSFANLMLRRYAKFLSMPSNFTILDQSDAEDAINLMRAQLGLNKTEKRFPRKKAVHEIISKSINKAQPIEDVLYEEYPHFMEWTEEIKNIRDSYNKYKASKFLLDYDDLLIYFRDLLVKNEDIRVKLSKRFKYIMVDEYQDTNKLQAFIACLLASEHHNIMVVGDDAQSIYSFRGANFRNILDFPKIFKEAKIITLEENYRSTQKILNLTNDVIRYSKEGFEKNLYTKRKGGSKPVYIETRDENGQSKFIADKILELREEGVELKDIAVLFRSGWHSNDLEIELSSRDIPFAKYGGQKFVEAAHIKDIVSYLRIMHNASDEISWHRILLLMRGVGSKTATQIINEILVHKQYSGIDSKFTRKIEDLRALFEIFHGLDDCSLTKPAELIRIFMKHYEPLLKEKYDDFNKRLGDLDSLIRIASRYDSLENFLVDLALEPPERNIIEAGLRDKDDSGVTLSTIHSAKGLEWHTVFIIYVAEGHLPSYLSLEDEEAIEEERRLFYVASTRAKENLFLLKPHIDRAPRNYFDNAGSVITEVSRFLREADIMDKHLDILEMQHYAEHNYATGKNGMLEMMKDYFRYIDDI